MFSLAVPPAEWHINTLALLWVCLGLFLVLFLFVTGISILKPGAFVVKYNLEHMNYYTKWDIYNWMDLSYDIVPELTKIDVHKIVLEDEAPQEKTEAKQE